MVIPPVIFWVPHEKPLHNTKYSIAHSFVQKYKNRLFF